MTTIPAPSSEAKRTEIVLILDKSGSMHGLESDTIGGINAVIEKNKALPGEATVTTILFNEKSQTLHDRVDIREVKPLTERDYQTQGCTALLDAVGAAIEHIDKVQRYMPEGYKADNVLFAIATDGLENASRDYTYSDVKRLIGSRQEMGWEFVFLGANIDVAAEAERIGVRRDRAVKYACDSAGTEAVFESVAKASASVRRCGSVAPDWAGAVKRDNARRK